MLSIDRLPGDPEDATPSVADAQVARDAAKDALDKLRRERESLPALRAAAVERADFADAARYRDQMALIEDRVAHAQQVLARSEVALLAAQETDAAHDASRTAEQLRRAFAAEEAAQEAAQRATAKRLGVQAQMQAIQSRREQLRQQHAETRRTLDGKE